MDCIELNISTSQEAQELISNFLIELGSQGVVLEDNSPLPPFSDSEREPENEVGDCVIKGYFPSESDLAGIIDQIRDYLSLLESQVEDVGSKTIQTRILYQEDWASNWKKYFKPIQVGKQLIIKPAWEHYEGGPHQIVIDIDPGMAFGTGKHETTQLCLELLEEHVYAGVRVLDVGTGSGILAVAAAKLGASRVLGLDTDLVALQYAQENLIKNAVQGKVHVHEGSLNALGSILKPFDLIIVNIRPQVILSMLDSLKRYRRPKSTLILSGILQTELQGFIEDLNREQLIIKEERFKEEWAALVCV